MFFFGCFHIFSPYKRNFPRENPVYQVPVSGYASTASSCVKTPYNYRPNFIPRSMKTPSLCLSYSLVEVLVIANWFVLKNDSD